MSVEPFFCSFVCLLVLMKRTQMTQTAVDSLSVLAGGQEYPSCFVLHFSVSGLIYFQPCVLTAVGTDHALINP